jgi:hypothetical protein
MEVSNIIKKIIKKLLENRLYIILLLIIFILLIIWEVRIELAFSTVVLFPVLVYVINLKRKFILNSLAEAKRHVFEKKLQTISLIAILFLFINWELSYEAIILWMLFFSFLFYGWESRIIAGLALLFLLSCPFLLAYKESDLAEQMAVYAYYFLVMTVTLQIADLKRAPEGEGLPSL